MSDTTTNVSVNRQHKDRLFTMIFGDTSNKKNILSLYNALYDTHYTNEEDVEITTIEDAIYIKMKNDVSLLLDNCLSLWEQQSTYNPNMPVRGLIYFGNLYNSYIKQRNLKIYNSTLVKLPTPKYIVFYNGTKEREPVEKIRLSDAFMTEDSFHEFEWTATMINLNKGKNEKLLSKCKPLSDYMVLVNKINCYKKTEKALMDAVNRAIEECIEENVLVDFLRKHRGDIMSTCLTEFDEELYKEGLLEEGHRLGLAEGLAKGHELGLTEGHQLGLTEGHQLGLTEGHQLGLTEGQKEANIDNARNLFQNNAPYALVRASITQLTDAELDDIYNEVKKKKAKENK